MNWILLPVRTEPSPFRRRMGWNREQRIALLKRRLVSEAGLNGASAMAISTELESLLAEEERSLQS
ncbi:MAG: hypothetical protein AAF430_22000 [Myxococcota bacterium]